MRSGLAKDRSQFYKDLALQFYGANRPGAKVSQGMLDQFWLWSMQAGLKNAYESIKAFSETDFTEDLKKFDVPTLVLHGEDDQIVPVKDSAKKSARLIKGAKEIYYPGAPHGLTATHQDQVNADLLAFYCQWTKGDGGLAAWMCSTSARVVSVDARRGLDFESAPGQQEPTCAVGTAPATIKLGLFLLDPSCTACWLPAASFAGRPGRQHLSKRTRRGDARTQTRRAELPHLSPPLSRTGRLAEEP